MDSVTSFASIKRRLEVGTRVTMTHHSGHGPGDTFKWGRGEITLPLTREVAVRQTNAIAFLDPRADGGKSWVYWPPAKDVTVHDERRFTLDGQFAAHPITYVIEEA